MLLSCALPVLKELGEGPVAWVLLKRGQAHVLLGGVPSLSLSPKCCFLCQSSGAGSLRPLQMQAQREVQEGQGTELSSLRAVGEARG